MNAKEQLRALVEKMNREPAPIAEEKDRVFQFDLKESGSIQVQFKDGKAYMIEEATEEPNVTLKMNDESFIKMLNDDLNTTMAFMSGKLKVDGSMGLAMKLQQLVKEYKEVS
ncbi:SCP2 sterol-binding domain-containing protein [Alkalihalophilus pseudofirmus]|uniref:SCP2 sterol-binding domain-containing protein n=1 Tax=Alkalihalophilus pseudofirmus TaxID=79885 RepID=UPI00259B6DFE|nr:SCP2 sterol-binding domain-containing protein [Alkalihalophilus pseudofirmus]WEG15419.1 SCP2 sterol-binding domain-containing protein [Alkalihalophilus pseudofirmus]